MFHRFMLFPAVAASVTMPVGVTYAQMPVTKVVVVEARLAEAPSTITVVGTVEPLRRSRVCPELGGLVKEMPGRQGDLINALGVICRLNDDTLRLRLAEEQARLAALTAKYDELLAGTREAELRRLEALMDEAVAQFERWKFEMTRIEALYAHRDSNDKEYQDTRASFLVAERRKIAAEASYSLGVEGPRAEVVAQGGHAVAEQKAVVDRISGDLDKTTIRAPFGGYIVERFVEIGEWIAIGSPVVEMVDLTSVLVCVDVPESAFVHLTVGEPARVRVDALDRVFSGVIKHITPQADPGARTFPVEIEVDNPKRVLAAGMFARATVPAGPAEQVVAVPKDAIVEKQGVAYVATVVPDERGGWSGVLSPVAVGADVGDWIAITSGNIRVGMRVITRGTERMLPFPSPVEIVDERGVPAPLPHSATTTSHKEGA